MANRNTVTRFLFDMPPATEPLFDELRRLCQQLGQHPPTAAILGFVMVAPIPEIREHLTALQSAEPRYLLHWVVSESEFFAPWAMHDYIPKSRPAVPQSPVLTAPPSGNVNEPGMPIPPERVQRSAAVATKAKRRDGNICLFSGTSKPAAAHIFPFATSEKKQFGNISEMLHAFWGVPKALAWRRHFEDARITQSPKNYLSLNHQIHVWFDDAQFALKPLRQTSTTEIVVQWHWLKRSKLLPRTRIGQSQQTFLQMAELNDTSWGSCLAHRRTGVPIETGQTFVIRAEDPEDLPSFELLELQWNLLRVAAICGAANVSDASYYDLDDDEVCNLVTSGGDETVTTGQTEVVTEAPQGSESDHTGSPPEQVEHTVASRHIAPTDGEFRDG
ncbi:hypothetical protein C8A05DRAFT_46684 [Staphylotrichum tortipilum]|uniref:HNH nuclease domain-containing protein n=1 Tax=Staphylotrichum tortipilum TaxID=2831512 RepID=A0AAN6RQF1_9PEZI|nr:hypothetical protein C8A05DRAFT_46684 [Staphylotrichum longicolle]